MRFLYIPILLVGVTVGFVAAAPAVDAVACPAQTATEFALTYGEPILAWEKALRSGLTAGGPNKFVTATTLASPSATGVVRPNFDTLFMSLPYDVSHDDIELIVPKIPSGRFWSFSFYTPYGDNFLNFGALSSATAGTYLLTVTGEDNNTETLGVSHSSQYQGVVYSPETIGFLLVRIVVTDSDDDIAIVNQIQRQIYTRVVSRRTDSSAPPLSLAMFTNTSSTQADHILKLTALYGRTFPTVNGRVLLSEPTISNLSLSGITTDGQYSKPSCVDQPSAYTEINPTIGAFYRGSVTTLNNGWNMPKSDEIGKYGTNYLARASVARWAYLALTNDVAIYPFYKEVFTLQRNESYILRFSKKPPVGKLGFWSTTMYDTSGYLVNNPIGRYAIGDRNDITFADGSLVYDGNTDGPFEILIQAAWPPDNWTSNWLPSPKTPGPFELLLRFYAPRESLLNGSYAYPEVIKGLLKQ